MSVGLCILSWRGAATLKPSLESYAQAGLLDEFSETQLFLPDPDKAVLDVAKKYDIAPRTQAENLGIRENMAAAAAAMTSEYILMLENDCPIIEPIEEVRRQVKKSLELLRRDDVIMSRLRSIRSPGQAFSGLSKYRRLQDHYLKARVIKNLRPNKFRRLSGYALYDGPHPDKKHPEYFQNVGDGFYLIDALVMPWTNQSILLKREFFLNEIIPLARSVNTKRHANKLPNLEIELNKTSKWRRSGWKIACGPGLFTHERIGDGGYE